jgi:hypothetical protein
MLPCVGIYAVGGDSDFGFNTRITCNLNFFREKVEEHQFSIEMKFKLNILAI